MKDKKLLIEQALKELEGIAGVVVELADYPFEDERGYDALVRLRRGSMHRDYMIEARPNLTNNTLLKARERQHKAPGTPLLVTKYVNPKMAERMREADMPFIDTAGNAYINEPELFLYIKGNKPDTGRTIGAIGQGRAFKPKGLRVTFALLCNPELRQARYEDIANKAKVALGTVAGVMQDLRQQGYLLKTDKKNYRLLKGNELLDKWVDAYITHLRPALLIKRYQTPENDYTWREASNLADVNGYIGGEVAAAKLTDYLKPGTLTLYADKPLTPDFRLRHGLREDPEGNVEVIFKFWNFDFPLFKENKLVHPILIYADLLAMDDARLLETARKMIEEDLLAII